MAQLKAALKVANAQLRDEHADKLDDVVNEVNDIELAVSLTTKWAEQGTLTLAQAVRALGIGGGGNSNGAPAEGTKLTHGKK
jgi:hypothetical protein